MNRSRTTDKGYKVSVHIRLPGYVIQRAVLLNLVSGIITRAVEKIDSRNRILYTLLSSLDKAIYRSNGSLRMTDTKALYRTALPMIHVMSQEATDAAIEQHKRSQKLMPEGDGLNSCRDRVSRVLRE